MTIFNAFIYKKKRVAIYVVTRFKSIFLGENG